MEREKKKLKSFYLSIGNLATLRRLAEQDGCSQNELLAIAINILEIHRNYSSQLLNMTIGQRIQMPELSIEKDFGVYQVTVKKCNDVMLGKIKMRKRELIKLYTACDVHLEQDLCTTEEREVFTKFVAFAKDKILGPEEIDLDPE
jgi:hypothetical protein